MDLLIPSTGLLFWMTITFLVVFFLLWKFGFPVITGMVKERQAFIDESLKKAHEANERLANIQKEGESILQEAREKQAQMLKEAAATRDAIVEQAQTKARSEGARLLEEAKATIEQEKKAAIADIRQQVATLSVQIAEKVLKQNLKDDKAQMDLIGYRSNIDEICEGALEECYRPEAGRCRLSGDDDGSQELSGRTRITPYDRQSHAFEGQEGGVAARCRW